MKISPPFLKCLLPTLALCALTGCHQDDGQANRLQEEINSLGEQQGQAQSELNRMKMQLNSLGQERDGLKQEKAKLDADLETLRKSLDQIQKDFAAYRTQYKLSMREKAPGLPLADFLVDGKSYQKVRAREATEELLTVMHDSGMQKFPWAALPDNVRTLFGQEKPGEYPMIDFTGLAASTRPATLEEQIARHDTRMTEMEQKIRDAEAELSLLTIDDSANRKALSDAKYKKLDTLNLERARNAYTVKRTQLDAELRRLNTNQEQLMREDPRKKKRK